MELCGVNPHLQKILLAQYYSFCPDKPNPDDLPRLEEALRIAQAQLIELARPEAGYASDWSVLAEEPAAQIGAAVAEISRLVKINQYVLWLCRIPRSPQQLAEHLAILLRDNDCVPTYRYERYRQKVEANIRAAMELTSK